MFLNKLVLGGFRGYRRRELEFKALTTILVGPNAVGKTNVLEAVYLLATGDSFRAQKIEEMVNWDEEVAHVQGFLSEKSESKTDLGVTLTRGVVQGKRVNKRLYKVNGIGRRKLDFTGNLRAVLFCPEDMQMVTGSPGRRRRFLDAILILVDRDYRRSLSVYENGLRRRNRILDSIRDNQTDRRALIFWDQLLIKHGNILTDRRRELIQFLNEAPALAGKVLRIEYEASTISEKRLAQYAREEVAAGYSLVGPHRDDFKIISKERGTPGNEGRDLALYGSRGEQRMGVLWLKMGELTYVEEKTGERPLLLLDDIFSELDDEHDRIVMSLLSKQQTIITTTEIDGRFTRNSELAIERLSD